MQNFNTGIIVAIQGVLIVFMILVLLMVILMIMKVLATKPEKSNSQS